MIYWYLCFLLPVVTAMAHMAMKGRPFKKGQVVHIWLIHLVFWGIGMAGIFGFLANSFDFLSNWMAKDMGWERGSPFQTVLGFGLLAIGVLGFFSACIRGGFLVAAIFVGVTYAVGEGFVAIFNGIPTDYLVYTLIYDWGGSVLVVGLLLVYRTRVNRKAFWSCCVPERIAGRFPQ